MRLRTRLVVAFLILSVVPLAAVTYYSYTSQVRALRELATREADALSTDMTQRMKLVTTELSNRVEQLVDMTPVATPVVTPRAGQPKTATPAARVATSAPAPADAIAANVAATALTEARVSEALGAAAMLLRSVELQGMRRSGGPRPPGEPGRGNETRLGQSDQRAADAGRFPRPQPGEGRGGRPPRQGGGPAPSPPLTTVGLPPAVAAGAQQPRSTPGAAVAPLTPMPVGPPALPAAAAPGVPVAPAAVAGASAADRIVIDMGAITRDMYRKYVPEGGVQSLTSEQRQQMARDINQRVMGIAEGIRLSAAELQKKAQEVEKKAVAPPPLGAPPPAPAPPKTPATPPAAAAPATTAPSTTAPATSAPAITSPAPKMTRTS